MKDVIGLVRVSTEQQAGENRGGIPAQKQAISEIAQRFDLNVVETVEIVDVSGSNVLESPEMQYLLQRITDPGIEGVVAKELSRLIRPQGFDHFRLFNEFVEHGIMVSLPSGSLDLSSDNGSLLGPIQSWVAGMERKQILARMNDAREALRRQGRNASGSSALPYGVGYERKTNRWFYTPEANSVRDLFNMFLKGEQNYEELSRRTALPRTTVRYILTNPIYAGWRVYDQRRDPTPGGLKKAAHGRQGERRKVKRRPEDIVRVEVLSPPLITMADFEAVQAVIERKRDRNWRSRAQRPSPYVYNGHLTCQDCGCSLYTHSSKEDYYVCKSKNTRERRRRKLRGLEPCSNRFMLRKKLEPMLDKLMAKLGTDRDFLTELLNRAETRLTVPAGRVVGDFDHARREQLRQKRERLIDMCGDGLITKEEFQRRSSALELELQRAEKKPAASAALQVEPLQSQLAAVLTPFAEWEFLGREDKRRLLRCLDPRFSIFKYRIQALELPFSMGRGGCNIGSHSKMATSRLRARRCRLPSRRALCWQPR